jgi:hypothetical protein
MPQFSSLGRVYRESELYLQFHQFQSSTNSHHNFPQRNTSGKTADLSSLAFACVGPDNNLVSIDRRQIPADLKASLQSFPQCSQFLANVGDFNVPDVLDSGKQDFLWVSVNSTDVYIQLMQGQTQSSIAFRFRSGVTFC